MSDTDWQGIKPHDPSPEPDLWLVEPEAHTIQGLSWRKVVQNYKKKLIIKGNTLNWQSQQPTNFKKQTSESSQSAEKNITGC